ncbi:MAG: HAMP domain-containing histidine kinase [Acidobacteria bacterium]|nr:HAMP domain-containing histidine kinase [Acidobacteriota bacterium]
MAPHRQLDTLSKSLEKAGREVYQRTRERLTEDIAAGRIEPRMVSPSTVHDFWESGRDAEFVLSPEGNKLYFHRREPNAVAVYEADLGDVNLHELTAQYKDARSVLQASRERDLNRGFSYTFLVVAAGVWALTLVALVWWAERLTRPVQTLTDALHRVADGDYSLRIADRRDDELGVAIAAYNDMAEKVEQSREKLVHVTRLSSWQSLARKMAHELKNSLTPIRLTMEEIAVRYPNDGFVDQASAIVVDEVTALEKRVRAFSELASEPPVQLLELDLNSVVEERIQFLKAAHPRVAYQIKLDEEHPAAMADADLVKGVLTNLLENAAYAAGAGGTVMASTWRHNGTVFAEVHDSGPGLSEQARSALFEPTISFKKGGMGLGLSIARRSAVLCGGDLTLIDSKLGGAAFRLTLPTHHS